jgi:hypothetical protein
MQQKMNHGPEVVDSGSGRRRLLMAQLLLFGLCLWLGLILHYFRESGALMTAGVVLLAFNVFVVAALGLPRTIRRFAGSLMLAVGLMYALGQLLPAGWTGGQGFIFLTLACTTLAVWLTTPHKVR